MDQKIKVTIIAYIKVCLIMFVSNSILLKLLWGGTILDYYSISYGFYHSINSLTTIRFLGEFLAGELFWSVWHYISFISGPAGLILNYFIAKKIFIKQSDLELPPELEDSGSVEKHEQSSLVKKYSLLKSYQIVLYALMGINTIWTINSVAKIMNMPENMRGDMLIPVIVTYVISMFSMYCMTIIINFLFDLEKYKTDK